MKSDSLTAVLLAGGRSRRMGRDKAFLDVGGQPLWCRQAAKLEAVAGEVFLSVRDAESAPESPMRKIFDPSGARGPLGGLAAALRAAGFARVLVLAVDLPAMTPEFLRLLAAGASADCGLVPELDGFYQGTAAVYPRVLLPLVEEVLAGGDVSFQHLIRRALTAGMMAVRPVAEEERPLFANWNTPDSLPEAKYGPAKTAS